MSECPKCQGRGSYMYDENHWKPCEVCCHHDHGWWELTEHFEGYVEGGDNRCCKAGCGAMARDVFSSKQEE